jgi:lipopolysaccharide heptosyltransferase II
LKILLVRLRQIGDVVFTTPAIHALRDTFPSAELTYLVEAAAAPVVTGNPHLTRVHVIPRARGLKGFLSDLSLGRQLKREGYDLVIDFHGGPRASLLTWLTGAKMRVGYTVVGRTWMYTTRVARSRQLLPRHSVVSQWDLLLPLGIVPPDREQYACEMPVDEEVARHVSARLETHGVGTADRLIVMHVSAGNPFRRWPLGSFAEVAAALASDDESCRLIVTSGPSEQDAAARVIAEARARLAPHTRGRVLDSGEWSLTELRALLDRAALFIGGDSGPMHVASTSQVPMVSLYGPTLPARSAPWRPLRWGTASVEISGLECRPCDQRVCAPGDFRCLTRISAGAVIEASRRLLRQAVQ